MKSPSQLRWSLLSQHGRGLTVLLVAMRILTLTASAHRLDEYLQATLITIEPGEIRLQLNFTPGEDVSTEIIGLVDKNHDGDLSPAESRAYAELALKDLTLQLDDRPLTLTLVSSRCSPPEELRTGVGTIHIELRAAVSSPLPGRHQLAFCNKHLPKLSVYLVNAVVPKSKAIEVVSQVRNEIQSEGRIEFNYRPRPSSQPVRIP